MLTPESGQSGNANVMFVAQMKRFRVRFEDSREDLATVKRGRHRLTRDYLWRRGRRGRRGAWGRFSRSTATGRSRGRGAEEWQVCGTASRALALFSQMQVMTEARNGERARTGWRVQRNGDFGQIISTNKVKKVFLTDSSCLYGLKMWFVWITHLYVFLVLLTCVL